ncbi:hypothetical protein IMSHALPRED_003050 [Imshaugia aleurites]|uniref:Uncharacterized protein n=1 Tax=Imshaugia aleurites TaxID=172621 RepID=A0A8H3F664_9LECA|nr:hypothetical protein IMSHALPRED_003050 [Imshaugia aleurites]
MQTILSPLLAIYVLSAGALATPASIDGRSSAFGTLGQDADLTIKTFDTDNCVYSQTTTNFDNVTLSWGVTQKIYDPTNSFKLSRALKESKYLDWSDGQDCANFLRDYHGPASPDGTVLQAYMCYNIDLDATCVNLWDASNPLPFG